MGAEWPVVELGDAVERITVGHVGPMAHEYIASGIPFLRSQNVTAEGVSTDELRHISPQFHNKLRKSALRTDDVVVVRTGRPGTAAVVPASLDGSNCSDLVVVRPGQSVNPRFLAGFVNSVAQGQIAANIVGAVQQHFNVGAAKRLRLALPPLPEQRAIASVLGALDDMVESDRQVAASARAVLMYAIPRDGDSRPLDGVATFANGGALTKHATGDGRPILRIKELKAGVSAETPRTSALVRPTHEVGPGDLLFSWSGTLLTHRWTGEPSVLNQHIFRVGPIEPMPLWLIEAWIEQHLAAFQKIAADKATTMGHIQRHHLSEAAVLVPDDSALHALRDQFDSLDALRMGALSEARTLTAIRDALLPKLVSGQIRVPLSNDPEEALGAAADALDASPD